MRQRVVLGILLGIFVTLTFIIVGRVGTAVSDDAAAGSEASVAGSDSTGSEATGSVDTGVAQLGDADLGEVEPDQVEPKQLDRPIKIIATSWELIAPGVVANGGSKPADDSAFSKAGVQVEFAVADNMQGVRQALARGGEAKSGADVAIVALPSFVASYEKLRALEPRVFFSVGWSRGREALASSQVDGLTDIVEDDSVPLRGVRGEAATYFSLYLMNLAGIPLQNVDLVDEVPNGAERSYAAISRGRSDLATLPDGHRTLITTADAQGLVTYVAIAPEGFLRRHVDDLTTWAGVWQEGREELARDVPAAARQIAANDKGLEALDLVDLLGSIELATIRDNARLSGLSGRSPLTLDKQFQLAWRVWRDFGVLSTPRPEAAPIANEIVAAIARSAAPEDQARDTAPSMRSAQKAPSTRRTLLVHRHVGSHHDEDEMLQKVGTLAGVFNRSAIRVALASHEKLTGEVLDQAAERYQVERERLLVGKRSHKRGTASIEIFAVE
jgi:hypothetical protein